MRNTEIHAIRVWNNYFGENYENHRDTEELLTHWKNYVEEVSHIYTDDELPLENVLDALVYTSRKDL